MNPVTDGPALTDSVEGLLGGAADDIGAVALVTEAAVCVACDSPRTGPFCAHCGQRVMEGRHTFTGLLKGAIERVFNLEQGISYTVKRLTVDPGGVVKDYLAGRTVVYVHPVAYTIIAFALFALVYRWTGSTGGEGDQVFWAALVFFLAAASRVVFARARFNYVEHVILNMFLFAHAVLLITGVLVVGTLPPLSVARILALGALMGAAVYFGWAYSRIFAGRPVVNFFGGLLSLVGGIGLWLGARWVLLLLVA